MLVSLSVSPASIATGSPSTFSTSVSGGLAAYKFAYAGLPGGCGSADAANLSCTPSEVGTFVVTVTVTDAQGMSANASTNLDVGFAPGLLSLTGPNAKYWIAGAVLVGAAGIGGAVLSVRRRKASKVPSRRGSDPPPPPTAEDPPGATPEIDRPSVRVPS